MNDGKMPQADRIAQTFGFVSAIDLIRQSPELQSDELSALLRISPRTLNEWRRIYDLSAAAKRGFGTRREPLPIPALVIWIAKRAGLRVGNAAGRKSAEYADQLLSTGVRA